MGNDKIVIYQTEDGQTQIDVRLENEMIDELADEEVCAKNAHTKLDRATTCAQIAQVPFWNTWNWGEIATVKEYLTIQQKGNRAFSRKVTAIVSSIVPTAPKEGELERENNVHFSHVNGVKK